MKFVAGELTKTPLLLVSSEHYVIKITGDNATTLSDHNNWLRSLRGDLTAKEIQYQLLKKGCSVSESTIRRHLRKLGIRLNAN